MVCTSNNKLLWICVILVGALVYTTSTTSARKLVTPTISSNEDEKCAYGVIGGTVGLNFGNPPFSAGGAGVGVGSGSAGTGNISGDGTGGAGAGAGTGAGVGGDGYIGLGGIGLPPGGASGNIGVGGGGGVSGFVSYGVITGGTGAGVGPIN
ncbi:hypothetical protein vseg_010978 [Gypsophila vaccaria]